MAFEITNQTRQQHVYNLLSGKSITLMPVMSTDTTGRTDVAMVAESDATSSDIVNGCIVGDIAIRQIHTDQD